MFKKLLAFIDRLLDPQPAPEPEEATEIDFKEFFTEDLYSK